MSCAQQCDAISHRRGNESWIVSAHNHNRRCCCFIDGANVVESSNSDFCIDACLHVVKPFVVPSPICRIVPSQANGPAPTTTSLFENRLFSGHTLFPRSNSFTQTWCSIGSATSYPDTLISLQGPPTISCSAPLDKVMLDGVWLVGWLVAQLTKDHAGNAVVGLHCDVLVDEAPRV